MSFKLAKKVSWLPGRMNKIWLWVSVLLAGVGIGPASGQNTNSTYHFLWRPGIYEKWGHTISEPLRQAAEQGDANALYGMFVLNDNTRYESDLYSPEALQWLRRAAEAGHPEAQVYLGFNLESRTRPMDISEAVHWYKLAAAQCHAGGEYRLALCFLRGKGVEQDEERGIELLRLATDQGQVWALTSLANAYARGMGNPRNESDRPVNLLLRAASADFVPACESLVARYSTGLGTDRDMFEAAYWYGRGAARSSRSFPLTKEMLQAPSKNGAEGISVEDAFPLFWSAGIKKETDSMIRVGQIYATGNNPPQNLPKAWEWFDYAASEGSADGATLRAEIETRMSAKELADAKAHANEFRTRLETLAGRLQQVNEANH